MSDFGDSVYLKTKVGAQVNAEGAEAMLRSMRDGSLCMTPMRGKYAELAVRGKLFFSYCAARATSVPATAQIGNIVWNPPGSGVNLILYKWSAQIQVTSATALGITLGYSAQATTPTTVTAADAYGCTKLDAASPASCKARAYAIGTIVVAPTPVFLMFHNTAAIAITGVDKVDGDFEGMFVVPPGYLVALSSITAAIAAVGMTSTLTWEEAEI